MKNLFFALLVAGTTWVYSCNSGDKSVSTKQEDTSKAGQTTDEEKTDNKLVPEKNGNNAVSQKRETIAAAESTEIKATAEMCDCINASLKDMSPKVQQIFIRAGNSERPLQVLQNEIVTISDKEQEELFVQLQRFSTDPKLQNCSEDIRKKYGLDPDNKASQERLLQAAKNNKDCELVYALIRIGMQQQFGAGDGN